MKKVFLKLLFVFLPLTLVAQEKGIHFEKGTFTEAVAKAKRENKKVFVDCYTLWCGPCRYMSANVFTADSVGDYMNPQFVSIKIDMEHGEGPELQKTFKVQGYPTFLLLDADAKELGRFMGMSPVSQFIEQVGRAVQGINVDAENEAKMKKKSVKQPAEKDTIYDEGKGLKFIECTYAEALLKAKQENKRIFMDCYTSWCTPCKKMLETVFKDTRIGNLMNYQFINVKVNMEEGEGKALSEKYKVTAYPTYLILNPDGTEFNRFTGSAPLAGFVDKLGKALMGEEDEYVKTGRIMEEARIRAREERKANLTKEPRAFSKSKVSFEKNADLSKAVKKAKKEGKKVLLMFADSGWASEYMFETVFNEDKGADYLSKGFVNILVDVKSMSGDKIADQYKYDSEVFPAYVILDGAGKEVGRKSGYSKRSSLFIESLESIMQSYPHE